MSKLISFGEVLVDQISDKNDSSLLVYAGGAPANVSVCYAKLTGESLFVGGIATDNNAVFLLKELQRFNVETSYSKIFQGSKTAIARVTLDEQNDRSFEISRNNTADTLFSKEHFIPATFAGAFFFHFCSNTLTTNSLYEATKKGIDLARKNSLLISFDVNLRYDLWIDNTFKIENRVSALFKHCHLIKMSLCELNYLANSSKYTTNEYIDNCLTNGTIIVIVTDGANDILCYTKSHCVSFTPPPIDVMDTTAAGDAFVGGFLFFVGKSIDKPEEFASFCGSSNKLREAIAFGSSCGALTCGVEGAFCALPNKSELDKFMAKKN